MRNHFVRTGIISASVILFAAPSVFAQVTTTSNATSSNATSTASSISSSVQEQIQALLAQIEALKTQIAQLVGTNTVSQATAQQIRQTFRFSAPLRMGMSGEEVRKLQKILSTDPTLFSEDNITGFFGPRTKKALERFQEHFGIDAIGIVGPKTMKKINELLDASNVEDEGDLDDHEFGDLDDNGGEQDDADSDHDGIRNDIDADDDNDGIADTQDNDGRNDDVNSNSRSNNGTSHENNATSSSQGDD
ncbi:MAG: peptidoglycan-binding domain-containing protein [Minisyncoccota bacterium]